MSAEGLRAHRTSAGLTTSAFIGANALASIPQDSKPKNPDKPRHTAGSIIDHQQGSGDSFVRMQSIGSLFAEMLSEQSDAGDDILHSTRERMAQDATTPQSDFSTFDARLRKVQRSPSFTLDPHAPTAMRLMRATLHNPVTYPEVNGRALQLFHCHSMFCQTGLPYRKPSDDLREFERVNGNLRLKIYAGEAADPKTGEFVKVGLPWGPKVRLVQIYLDSVAITTQSPQIETDRSLTAFLTGKLSLPDNGRTINSVKDALARLAASSFRFGILHESEGRAQTFQSQIIDDFDIWLPKEGQRVLFPSFVEFSPRYFASLMDHAVPLKLAAIAALSHNAMALDCYRWLAHRLHRVPKGKPTLLFWSLLYDQFSVSQEMRMADFRANFKAALAQVLTQYPEARNRVLIDAEDTKSLCKDGRGLWLYNAPPPVLRKQQSVLCLS